MFLQKTLLIVKYFEKEKLEKKPSTNTQFFFTINMIAQDRNKILLCSNTTVIKGTVGIIH
jgi:hypothetical protein